MHSKSAAFLILGTMLDIMTTAFALSRGFVETNPLYSNIAFFYVGTFGLMALSLYCLRYSRVFALTATGHIYAGILNLVMLI